MGLFSKDITTMDELFTHVLQDIYYAENRDPEGTARHDRAVDQA